LGCRYCDLDFADTNDALDHTRDWHPFEYEREIADSVPVDPEPEPPEGAADEPTPDTTPDPEGDPTPPAPQEDPMPIDTTPFGTAGRAAITGLVLDWETSIPAREDPETFIAWLQGQAAAAKHAATIVPDLVSEHHGRGPTGHGGVPEEQIAKFVQAFEEARGAEAAAYEAWANEYAAYVEAAQDELTTNYGREVLASAHAVHRGV
jgi:hypothetical protein